MVRRIYYHDKIQGMVRRVYYHAIIEAGVWLNVCIN